MAKYICENERCKVVIYESRNTDVIPDCVRHCPVCWTVGTEITDYLLLDQLLKVLEPMPPEQLKMPV